MPQEWSFRLAWRGPTDLEYRARTGAQAPAAHSLLEERFSAEGSLFTTGGPRPRELGALAARPMGGRQLIEAHPDGQWLTFTGDDGLLIAQCGKSSQHRLRGVRQCRC